MLTLPCLDLFQRVGSVDMSSPAPSFNSLPSSRKGRCVPSSMQCLFPLHQYAIFLFGGHLPSPYLLTHTHTPQRGPASETAGAFRVACSVCPLYTNTPSSCLVDIYPLPTQSLSLSLSLSLSTHTHLPNVAQLQKEQVRSEQHAVAPLHLSSTSRIFVPIRHFASVWWTFTTPTHLHQPPHPQRCPSSERDGYVTVIKAASI